MPLNSKYISSEKFFLDRNKDLDMKEIWNIKEYLEYFFFLNLKNLNSKRKKFKPLKMKRQQTKKYFMMDIESSVLIFPYIMQKN